MNNPLNPNQRDDIHLLAGAYAINALDDLERRRFEQHLTACGSCQDDVRGFQAAASGLGEAVAETPPPSLRTRVLDEVDRTRQDRPVSAGRRPRANLGSALAVAASLVMLLLGGAAIQQRGRAQRFAESARITEAPDARIVRLEASGGGVVQVTYSPSEGAAVLVADGLTPPADGRTYELWFVKDGTAEPVTTFDTSGSKPTVVRIKRTPASGSLLALTDEPDGGSAQPTTEPFATGEAL